MGRLAGFKYREVAGKLRALGWVFDRQAPGSHEIWRHAVSGVRYKPGCARREVPGACTDIRTVE